MFDNIKIACMFVFQWSVSICLVASIKNLVSNPSMHFPYPIFASSMANGCTAVLALAWTQLEKGLRYMDIARSAGFSSSSSFRCFLRGLAQLKPRIGKAAFAKGLLPIGMMMGVELALANTALKMLSVALRTMVHGCNPAAVLFTAWIFGLERLTWRIAAVVFLVVGGGIVCALGGPVGASELGLALAVTGLFMTALRWSMTQKLLRAGCQLAPDEEDRYEVLERLHARRKRYVSKDIGEKLRLPINQIEAPSPFGANSDNMRKAATIAVNISALDSENGTSLPSREHHTAPHLIPAELRQLRKARLGSKAAHVTKIEIVGLVNPITSVVCFSIALVVEPSAFQPPVVGWLPILANVGCFSVCVLLNLLVELKLVQLTSAFTMSLAGLVHNTLIVCSGVVLFGDSVTFAQVIGFSIISFGVVLHAWWKTSVALDAEEH
eukprot:TRINITY_DN24498_c0_g1_i1.p1 TRINITY_DN24498_c0_g1~~TRINITY_DN24498_c0_g1_i1.p1  ORF type:complete len:438 (+),score=71.18 TRINITY_DN24498_c0_g1_i1:35-1348(+)